MNIRLMGLPVELDQFLAALSQADVLDVIEISGPYPNRGNSRMVRIYIEARPGQGSVRTSHDALSQAGRLPPELKKQLP